MRDIRNTMPPLVRTGIEQWVRDYPSEAYARLLKVRTEMVAMLGEGVTASAVNRLMDAEADKWGAPRLPHMD